jgi:hypothetical protein
MDGGNRPGCGFSRLDPHCVASLTSLTMITAFVAGD